jgi:hypothetical protein
MLNSYHFLVIPVANNATSVPAFARVISTGMVILQMRTDFALATRRLPMRSIALIVLPFIGAVFTSGLMFTATLA